MGSTTALSHWYKTFAPVSYPKETVNGAGYGEDIENPQDLVPVHSRAPKNRTVTPRA